MKGTSLFPAMTVNLPRTKLPRTKLPRTKPLGKKLPAAVLAGTKLPAAVLAGALLAAVFPATLPVALAQSKGVCVTAQRANLRAGPGKNHRITWEVHRNMPLVQVGEEGEWVKVRDVDGDIHWIFGSLVSAGFKCVTVRAPKANIRKKPSSRAELWFTVEKYSSFRFLEKKGKWMKIQKDQQVMWVFHTLVWPN